MINKAKISSLRRKISIWSLKLLSKNRFEKLTLEQRQALIIFGKTINYQDSIPTQMPDGSKFFVEYKPKGLFIVVDFNKNNIKVTNHVFQYVIDMNDRMAMHINNVYSKHTEKIRTILENKYDSNVQNSLRNVIENIK